MGFFGHGGHREDTEVTGSFYIAPQTNTPFIKPLAVLTNDQTASSGDVLAMILKAIPRTTLIGDNTLGFYSDMYGFELPNKWLVSLSNQKYLSPEIVCYEGKGTLVDIRVKNTRQDIINRKDPVVLAALGHLNKK